MRRLNQCWLPALIWMSVIFGTSCTYVSSRQLTETITTRGPVAMSAAHFAGFWESWWWLFVKGYHVFEFSLLTLLLIKGFRGRLMAAGAFAVMFACSDEFHQTFVKGRGGRWTDVVIDCIGIFSVAIIANALSCRKDRVERSMLANSKRAYAANQMSIKGDSNVDFGAV